MDDTVFYKKQGRKYVPVSHYNKELQESMPYGSHLVQVMPGKKSTKFNVEPNYIALIAAAQNAMEAMVDELYKATLLKPSRVPLTEEQKIAWENLQKSFGNEMFSIYRDSAYNVVNVGLEKLIEEASKLLENPSVKNAYDQFMLVSALTKDHA